MLLLDFGNKLYYFEVRFQYPILLQIRARLQ